MMQRLALNPAFAKLWAASALSNVGDGIARAAFPLLAALLTRDPALVAGFTFALTLPWLLFSLHAGALIDRWDRRQVLAFAAAGRMLLLACLSIVAYFNAVHLAFLYAVAFLYGLIEVFFDNASMTILPSVVDKQNLERANSRLFATSYIGNGLLGPSLGGLLFAVFVGLPFLVHGGLLVFVTALIAALRGSFRSVNSEAGRTRLSRDIGAALGWLRKNRVLFSMAVVAGITNVAGTAAFSILVLYALQTLQIGEAGYGLLLSVGTLGGLLGTLVAAPLSQRLGSGNAILGAILIEGFSYLLMVARPSVWLTAAALGLHALAIVLWNVNAVSLRQSITPDHLLGRVNSAYRLVGEGATPLGAVVGGFLAKQFGLTIPFLMGGAAVLLAFFVVLPLINNRTVLAARQLAQQ